MRLKTAILVAGSGALMSLASGCHVYTEPVGTYEVTSAPYGYDAYPHTYYEGRQVYYVNGRWGYPQQRGWRYYQTEPAPLVRHRTTVQAAPPAGPRYAPGPGARRFENAPPASAPPAVQVR